MTPITKFPFRAFLLFGTIPALLIGAGLWFLGDLVPQCVIDEQVRQTSPDGQFDLVVFSRDCGEATAANTQAALVPPGEAIPYDAASFLSLSVAADLQPRWDAYGNIEIAVPPGAEPLRRDPEVAGIAVVYR